MRNSLFHCKTWIFYSISRRVKLIRLYRNKVSGEYLLSFISYESNFCHLVYFITSVSILNYLYLYIPNIKKIEGLSGNITIGIDHIENLIENKN